MAKEIIRRVPREVCHADIFLDDVKEVADIVRTEFDKLEEARDDNDILRTLEFTYEIDDRYIFSTIEELENHGGKVSEFSLNANIETRFKGECANRYKTQLLQVRGRGVIQFHSPPGLSSEEWSIFGKVDQIITARKNRIKTFGDSIPWLLPMLSGYVICFLAAVILSSLSPKSAYFRSLVMLFSMLGILWLCFMAILIYSIWRKNFVLLRYSRQNEREREDMRRERWGKFAWILLGAILGALLGPLGQLLVAKLKH